MHFNINNKVLADIANIELAYSVEFGGIGNLSIHNIPDMLSWLVSDKYIGELKASKNIKAVIIPPELEDSLSDVDVLKIIHEDPMSPAIKLINFINETTKVTFESVIHPSATIHLSAFIAPFNVRIMESVIVEPLASIMADTVIHKGSLIRSGARIGADNFDRHHTKDGEIIRMISNNKAIIHENVEVGYNSVINKGDSGRDTVIGKNTAIHDAVQVCHGVQIGENCHVWGGVFFCGHSTIGSRTRIQPRAIISNMVEVGDDCHIGINALVTKDLDDREVFFGNRSLRSKASLDLLKAKFQNK